MPRSPLNGWTSLKNSVSPLGFKSDGTPSIVGDPLHAFRLLTLDFDEDLTDTSPLAQTMTAGGDAVVVNGSLVLDGNGDFIQSNARRSDFATLNSGAPWTLEWWSERPTNSNNTVFSTSDASTSKRGLWVDERSDGSLRVFVTRASSGVVLMDAVFPAGSIPVGDFHKVIEFWPDNYASVNDVCRLGVNGNYIGSQGREVNLATIGTPTTTPRIGALTNLGLPYNGSLRRVQISRTLVYDLWNNSTYDVPTELPAPQQAPGFHLFTNQHYPANDVDDDILNLGYKAEPDLVPLATPGHAISISHSASQHVGGVRSVISRSKTEDYGKSFTPLTTLQSDGTDYVRGPAATVDSNGRVWAFYNYTDSDGDQQGAGVRVSDDEGEIFETEVDLSTEFSATLRSSNWRIFGCEETSQGMMMVAYNSTGQCEVAFSSLTGTPSFGAPVVVYTGQTDLNEPTPVRCDTTNKIVIVTRNEGNNNRNFNAYKSADGGLSWATAGTAQFSSGSQDHGLPVGAKYLADRNEVMLAWCTRDGARECFYTLTDAAAFYTDPTDGWDVSGPATPVKYQDWNRRATVIDGGYPSICYFGNDEVLISHYEPITDSNSFTRLMVCPVKLPE